MTTILAFADDIRDIKPPLYFRADHLFLIILGSVIIFAILAFLALYIYKKKKKEKETDLSFPPRPPHEVAYELLRKLRERNLPAFGFAREYYFELSDIVRHYVEDRFGLKAPEMTTEEFLSALKDSELLSGGHKKLLGSLLSLSDIAKFAKYGPSGKEMDSSFDIAKKFVDETKAASEPEVEDAIK